MITGNPMIRDKKLPDINSVESWALSFRCFDDDQWLGPSNLLPPGAGRWDTVHLPNKPCDGGIRANIFFPTYVLSIGLFLEESKNPWQLLGREEP